MTADCDLCGDTGWTTAVNPDGDASEIPCPLGCLAPHEVPY